MYQWLHIIFNALHTLHHIAHKRLTDKNRNPVTVPDSKIAQWRRSDHHTFGLYRFTANNGGLVNTINM